MYSSDRAVSLLKLFVDLLFSLSLSSSQRDSHTTETLPLVFSIGELPIAVFAPKKGSCPYALRGWAMMVIVEV